MHPLVPAHLGSCPHEPKENPDIHIMETSQTDFRNSSMELDKIDTFPPLLVA